MQVVLVTGSRDSSLAGSEVSLSSVGHVISWLTMLSGRLSFSLGVFGVLNGHLFMRHHGRVYDLLVRPATEASRPVAGVDGGASVVRDRGLLCCYHQRPSY